MKDEPGIAIKHTDGYGLSEDPAKNIVGVALQAMITELNIQGGFEVVINKKIKPGSGIGSSAASAAGIVVAANELLGLGLDKKELVRFAMEGEVIASGSRHADNLAPCIYGGLVLIRDTASLDIIDIPFPPLYITILHPQIEVKTSYSRNILPKEVPLKTAVHQWANVGGLIAGFMSNDYGLIARSLEDVIIEPVRSTLIPAFYEVKEQCMKAGALGGGISGSGPSVFMLSETEQLARDAENSMKAIYQSVGVDFKTYVTTVNSKGVEITGNK
jgi:homoserine kinase